MNMYQQRCTYVHLTYYPCTHVHLTYYLYTFDLLSMHICAQMLYLLACAPSKFWAPETPPNSMLSMWEDGNNIYSLPPKVKYKSINTLTIVDQITTSQGTGRTKFIKTYPTTTGWARHRVDLNCLKPIPSGTSGTIILNPPSYVCKGYSIYLKK